MADDGVGQLLFTEPIVKGRCVKVPVGIVWLGPTLYGFALSKLKLSQINISRIDDHCT